MSIVQRGVKFLFKRMPKTITPQQHALVDYGIAAVFFIAGAALLKRHPRAAISSLVCGGAITANSLITDYPGGVLRLISLETHGEIEASLAGIAVALPQLMGFGKDRESWFFELQGALGAAAGALTQFRSDQRPSHRVRSPEAA